MKVSKAIEQIAHKHIDRIKRQLAKEGITEHIIILAVPHYESHIQAMIDHDWTIDEMYHFLLEYKFL